MDIVLYTVPHLCVLVVVAYLFARVDFFDDPDAGKGELRGARFYAAIAIFTLIALYGTIYGYLTGAPDRHVTTYTVGVALVTLLFGTRPSICVALLSAAAILLASPVTLTADILALVAACVVCALFHRKFKGYDGPLFGIAAGLVEIIHMLLIVAFVRPVPAAKDIVYDVSFTMIVLNGTAVAVFAMIINDMISRNKLLEKDAYRKSELNVARNIQMSLLEKNFKIDPRLTFDAFLRPAMEVGGDLYSFLKTSEDKFCFILGDVSGKGIPAAITMSRTIALFRMYAATNDDPGKILSAMNDSLCANNTEQMFVTAALGTLDLGTGELRYANAGHTKPYIANANGDATEAPRAKGKPLGIIPHIKYIPLSLQLEAGQFILFYTDGVSEAENMEHEQFDARRIMESLSTGPRSTPEEVNQNLLSNVDKFADGTPQSDDIALLCVGVTPPNTLKYVIPNKIDSVANLASEVPLEIEKLTAEMKAADVAALVIEEIVSNTVKYGYHDGRDDEIEVGADMANDALIITITDRSDPFDPFSAPEPDLTLPPEKRPIGGLGIHLLRKRIKSYSYTTENGVNTLRVYI